MLAINHAVAACKKTITLSVSLLMLLSPVTQAQEPTPQPLPTNLSEALLRLQQVDTSATRQKQVQPVEFFSELPQNSMVSLDTCRAAAAYSEKVDGRAMVVLVGNRPGYQRYAPGWPHWKTHRLGQASESFVGVAAAMAVQEGLLKFDDLVSETITEWADDPQLAKVTIRQLITLTSGIEPGDVNYVSTYKEAIKAKSLHEPGKTFGYGTNAFQIFGELLCRKLKKETGTYDPMGYANYLNAKVFKPLKIEMVDAWLQTVDEEANVSLGGYMTAVDFAKFGALVCNGGNWEGQQLVDKDLFAEVLKGTDANPRYGMGFWLVSGENESEISSDARMIMPSLAYTKIDGMYAAAGNGRQRLYVIPDEQVVIVRLGDPKINLFRDEPFFRNLLVKRDEPLVK